MQIKKKIANTIVKRSMNMPHTQKFAHIIMTLSQILFFFGQRYSHSELTYLNTKFGGKVYVHAASA